MSSSFAGRRGEFVRISHQEREGDPATDVLGRIVSISRSAALASMKLSRVLSEAQAFYSAALSEPTSIYEMTGRPTDKQGRLVVIDLQGLSDTAKQIITALISSEILQAASSKSDPIRPCMVVFEEGHSFAPAGQGAVMAYFQNGEAMRERGFTE